MPCHINLIDFVAACDSQEGLIEVGDLHALDIGISAGEDGYEKERPGRILPEDTLDIFDDTTMTCLDFGSENGGDRDGVDGTSRRSSQISSQREESGHGHGHGQGHG